MGDTPVDSLLFSMDHIFGDSDDIDFGSTPSSVSAAARARTPVSASRPSLPSPDRSSRHPTHQAERSSSSVPSDRIPPRLTAFVEKRSDARSMRSPGVWVPVSGHSDIETAPSMPALSRLISGMKSSFLPREDDASVMRMIALSAISGKDPLFMIRQDDTTILLWSGFSTTTRAGHTYSTFPDMRLVFSEKDRIWAWILTDATIDVIRFQSILPTLGFPPIYATRDVIASFRNSITDTVFLESCRFFELFADGATSRRIGDIECLVGDIDLDTHLAIRSGGAVIGWTHIPLAGVGLGTSVTHRVAISGDTLSVGTDSFASGELLQVRWGIVTRHTMKFTFDTFFIDGLSIGVVAGYALGDREQLGENGVLLFTLEEDPRTRTISGHIFIDSRGFVHAHEMMYIHKELLKGIRSTYETLLIANPRIERGELVQSLRREITKYCYVLTGRTPVVMPVVIGG